MDAPLVTKLLLGVGAGLAAELLFELALPGLAHRVQQVWWIRALSGAPAHRQPTGRSGPTLCSGVTLLDAGKRNR